MSSIGEVIFNRSMMHQKYHPKPGSLTGGVYGFWIQGKAQRREMVHSIPGAAT